METVDKPVYELLASMAVAGTARELAQTLGLWVASGQLAAVAVWSLSNGGPLRPLFGDGVGEDVLGSTLIARADNNPLWEAIDAGHDLEIDPPEGLAHLPRWTVHVLHGAQGKAVGVALCGHRAPSGPEGLATVTKVLGPALERRLELDRVATRGALFESLHELVDDGVIVATPDGEILAYNPALANLTGWSRDEVEAHGWTNLVYRDPRARDEAQRAIAALTLGSPSLGVVRDLARKDGTTVRTRIWSRLHPSPSGFAPAMLGVMRDATGEETAIRRAIWEESQSQLERLAGGIAHEFNNLLAAIMGHADLIAMTDTSPQIRRHAETIVRSAERGREMSSQILAFSGTANSRPRAIPMARLVEQALELFGPRVPDDVALEVKLGPDLPALEVDPALIQQVLINLLSNALDAMPDGGTLTIEASRAALPDSVRYRSPTLADDGDLGHLRVRDSGPGFTREAAANLFVPFYSTKPGGHGVGLPAVRGIVGAHGGALDVHNDDGAVVDLYLPISYRPELDLPQLVAETTVSGARVWVVDDDAAVLEFSRISLEALGFEVEALDGVAALREALANAEHPDAVVLDVSMPDGGGLRAREALLEAGLDAPIVWTSGHAPEVVDLPADASFLQKPYTGRTLGRMLVRVLGR